MQIEHIVARKRLGSDALENLALACIDCNLCKSSNLAGLDPLSGVLTELFHPRRQVWSDHFQRQGPLIVGVTAIGRTTVQVLQMNSDEQISLRQLTG